MINITRIFIFSCFVLAGFVSGQVIYLIILNLIGGSVGSNYTMMFVTFPVTLFLYVLLFYYFSAKYLKTRLSFYTHLVGFSTPAFFSMWSVLSCSTVAWCDVIPTRMQFLMLCFFFFIFIPITFIYKTRNTKFTQKYILSKKARLVAFSVIALIIILRLI